jgi:hypothetical protein
VKMGLAAIAWAAASLLALAACGSAPPAGSASGPPASAAATPAVTATSVPSTPTPPDVPDFRVVAYQGDQVLGGHDGHFGAVFAAGRPVVLLYFAGL